MARIVSRLHRAWQLLPPRARRHLYEAVFAAAAPSVRPTAATPTRIEPPIVVAGALSAPTGLGEAARLTLLGLVEAGIDVSAVDLTIPLMQQPIIPLPSLPAPRPGPGTLLMFAQPPNVGHGLTLIGRKLLRDKRRVGCWVWDLTVLPQPWIDSARHLHEIVAPSRFCRDTFAAHLSLPVGLATYPLAVTRRPQSPRRAGDLTTFGVVMDLGSTASRKNPLGVLEAYRKAFGPGDAVRLLVKLRGEEADPVALARIEELAGGDGPPVEILTGDFSRERLDDWWAQIDVIVSLHRSEGFGLVPAEAMQRGVPAISTDWSATTEFLTQDTGWPVPSALVPARDETGRYQLPGAVWAEPDLDAAAAAMREAASSTAEIARRGRAAAAFAAEAFSTDRMIEQFGLRRSAPRAEASEGAQREK